MSVFSKNSKKKLALALTCASVLGGKAQAMNIDKSQSRQTLGAVGGVAVKNQPKKINWEKIVKIGGFTVAGLAALETIHSLIGGLTDSKAGSYSVGRAIRNRVKKNNQLDSEEQKKSNSGDKSGDENDKDDNELNKDNEEKDNENLQQSIISNKEMNDKKNIIVDGRYEINLDKRKNDKGSKSGNILISAKVINENIGQDEKDIEKCNIGLIDAFDKYCFDQGIVKKEGSLKDYILKIFENFKGIDKDQYIEFFDEFYNICTNKRIIHEIRVIEISNSKHMQFLIDDNNGYEIVGLQDGKVRISGINNYLEFDFQLVNDGKKDEDNEEENYEEDDYDFRDDEI